MASRSPESHFAPASLPDLPSDLFGDDDDLYGGLPSRPIRSANRGVERRVAARQDQVQRTRTAGPYTELPARSVPRNAEGIRGVRQDQVQRTPAIVPSVDMVTSIQVRPERSIRTSNNGGRNARRAEWARPILPPVHELIAQGFPNLLMALSAAVVVLLGMFTPLGLPVWAAGIFLPSVLLHWKSNTASHLLWRRAAMINIATMAMMFPVLVIRQSVVRIPFVDGGNGTMMAPAIATAAVLGILVIMAGACAVLSQEDPEYSAILFLPTAMMVPMLAGQSDLVNLTSALYLVAAIFAVSSVLTIVTSMLPGNLPSLVVPAAIGLEFILLTVFRNTSIFPTGAGNNAKILFFVIVVSTLALSILVPIMSVWIRQVTRLAQTRGMAG